MEFTMLQPLSWMRVQPALTTHSGLIKNTKVIGLTEYMMFYLVFFYKSNTKVKLYEAVLSLGPLNQSNKFNNNNNRNFYSALIFYNYNMLYNNENI